LREGGKVKLGRADSLVGLSQDDWGMIGSRISGGREERGERSRALAWPQGGASSNRENGNKGQSAGAKREGTRKKIRARQMGTGFPDKKSPVPEVKEMFSWW